MRVFMDVNSRVAAARFVCMVGRQYVSEGNFVFRNRRPPVYNELDPRLVPLLYELN